MADAAELTFRGELTDLLRRPAKDGVIVYPVTRAASVKDVIEALGPPHTEIHGLLADGRPVAFGHRLSSGERITVLPAAFPIDVTVPTLLRPKALPRLAFAVDANAGRLALFLRTLGFDAAYDRNIEDADLAEQAAREGRVVLSRDRDCLKRSAIVHGRVIRANEPREQLQDVLAAYGLAPPYAAFSRCTRCNTPLVPVDKAAVLPLLLPKTRRYFEEFHQCPDCGRVYWPGSHHEHMADWIRGLGGADGA
uniref:Twitching motility protein PilT n=1 Tax=Desulfovibrio sp. U5L TaxID=596152 RepID=I2PX94_9BACT